MYCRSVKGLCTASEGIQRIACIRAAEYACKGKNVPRFVVLMWKK